MAQPVIKALKPPSIALSVKGLRVDLARGAPIVEDIDLDLVEGEILGLIGESGSGKTTVALAMLGFSRDGTRISSGQVLLQDRELVGLPENELRRVRGKLISYVPQDPATSLIPSLRVAEQIVEVLRAHLPSVDPRTEIAPALERVHLPSDRDFQARYPHQLSGGQQQRLAIAIALACRPRVVVMDEPTTGLDVVTQAGILAEIERIAHSLRVAIAYVSHNLAVVGSLTTRIAVMYAGRIVEQGNASLLLERPAHPYTWGLLSSVPDHLIPRKMMGMPGVAIGVGDRPQGCSFEPRCLQRVPACKEATPPLVAMQDDRRVRCIRWQDTPTLRPQPRIVNGPPVESLPPILRVEGLAAGYGRSGAVVVAARDVSFSVAPGESVALVGESGSGKTTISRCIAGLHKPSAGRIFLSGKLLPVVPGQRSRDARRRIQIVFQNPYDSLNPQHTLIEAVSRPARLLLGLDVRAAGARALELLALVRLPRTLAHSYPRDLSGGERQRAAIARALAAGPDLLVCDEVTSALDVSVQAAVLELLSNLRQQLGLALMFVTHDLGVVASVCDRMLVLEGGVVRESGPVDLILKAPCAEYTRTLIKSAPRLPLKCGDASDEPRSAVSRKMT